MKTKNVNPTVRWELSAIRVPRRVPSTQRYAARRRSGTPTQPTRPVYAPQSGN